MEVGCGTGSDALWLASQGFAVTALDLAELAVEKARSRAAENGADCTFMAGDFLNVPLPEGSFSFAFDRGCFHSFAESAARAAFAQRMAGLLAKGGLWLSLIGSADDPPREVGPPRLTAQEVVTALEPNFEILSLTVTHFTANAERRPRAWACLMRKRVEV